MVNATGRKIKQLILKMCIKSGASMVVKFVVQLHLISLFAHANASTQLILNEKDDFSNDKIYL